MSDRLLKESDVLKAIDKRIEKLSKDPEFVRKNGIIDVAGVKKYILAIPSADRPRGVWIWSPRDTDGTVSGCCSNCSFSHLFIGGHTAQYNFCPNCGAQMKGADDEYNH